MGLRTHLNTTTGHEDWWLEQQDEMADDPLEILIALETEYEEDVEETLECRIYIAKRIGR